MLQVGYAQSLVCCFCLKYGNLVRKLSARIIWQAAMWEISPPIAIDAKIFSNSFLIFNLVFEIKQQAVFHYAEHLMLNLENHMQNA